ncbi:MAG: HlyC/CorC family transporter, partial [Kangiellaceae bacterium]
MSDDKPPSINSNTKPPTSKESTGYFKNTFAKLINSMTQIFKEAPQDRQDLISVLKSAEENALINPELLAMMEGVIHISELQARDIMIARPQMVVVDDEMGFDDMLSNIIESGHSRFPVIGDNRDDIEGIILAKDLLQFSAEVSSAQKENNKSVKFVIKDFLRPAAIIPESKRLDTLLKEFRTNRSHMAIVVDEYGSVGGLVTIEDVLEQIVGEIEDEFDLEGDEDGIQKVAENEYVLKGLTEIEEFNEYFSSQLDDDEYETIGGILLQAFGYVPSKDEGIE